MYIIHNGTSATERTDDAHVRVLYDDLCGTQDTSMQFWGASSMKQRQTTNYRLRVPQNLPCHKNDTAVGRAHITPRTKHQSPQNDSNRLSLLF